MESIIEELERVALRGHEGTQNSFLSIDLASLPQILPSSYLASSLSKKRFVVFHELFLSASRKSLARDPSFSS